MSKIGTGKVAPCGMDVMTAIYGRRAIRGYAPEKPSEAVIRQIIDAAIHAPSATNDQPWAFVVVQDSQVLKRLSDTSKKLTQAHLIPDTRLWEHRAMLDDPAFNVFYDAETLIVICAAPGAWTTNEDCCLAAQNLMLAAHGLGLGTCPIGFAREALNDGDVKKSLSIPVDYSVVMPIIVGYPRHVPEPTPRREARILSWK
jgi:nitroreductase